MTTDAPGVRVQPVRLNRPEIDLWSYSGAVAFPTRPLLGVRARYIRQTSCPCDYADVTVDFLPGAPGLEVPGDEDEYVAALIDGIREELAATEVAVRVVVRDLRTHEVDSREHSFRTAGRLAAREALSRDLSP